MGHGIFPNYGPNFIKEVCRYLSKAEAKDVFYTTKKERRSLEKQTGNEEGDINKKKKKR